MFDPIQERRTQKYTHAELKNFWQGPGYVVQRLLRENPALYQELHTAGEQAGVVGKSLAPRPASNVYKPPTRSYSAEELKLRGEFTESYCRQLFASGDAKAAKALYESDRESYEDAKDASISFNILPPRLTPRPAPAPVAAPEWTGQITNELADESGVPRGQLWTDSQIYQMCRQRVQRVREKQEAADAKVAQERASELAKLTAAQQLEQDARDQKQRDLDRLAVLIAPKPSETPEALDVAVQRAVAAEKQTVAE